MVPDEQEFLNEEQMKFLHDPEGSRREEPNPEMKIDQMDLHVFYHDEGDASIWVAISFVAFFFILGIAIGLGLGLLFWGN